LNVTAGKQKPVFLSIIPRAGPKVADLQKTILANVILPTALPLYNTVHVGFELLKKDCARAVWCVYINANGVGQLGDEWISIWRRRIA
jgi:hypothetical protein